MLNFRNTNLVFGCLLISIIGLDVIYNVPAYIYITLSVVYFLLLSYGSYYVGSNFFIQITCSAKTNEKVIALSFDDGPDASNTPQVLQILKNNGANAAFFCIGKKIPENNALLKQVFDEGHVIGNHTFSHHFWFDLFSSKRMIADMQIMDSSMQEVIGKTPKLFRPPYGVTNPNLKKAINHGSYTPVGWSVRSMDTVIKDEKKLLNNMVKKLKPGAVFLFHDTSNTTLAILPEFIKQVKSNGYEIIRLDKLLNLQAYV